MERRHSQQRNEQLDAAHQLMREESHGLDALMEVVRENTRAVSQLQESQARLIQWLESRNQAVTNGIVSASEERIHNR